MWMELVSRKIREVQTGSARYGGELFVERGEKNDD
jgi:hypothetical protein